MQFPFGQGAILAVNTPDAARDSDGNQTDTTLYVPLPNAAFAPGGSSENVAGQDVVTAQPQLLLPEGSIVPKPTDEVLIGATMVDARTVQGGDRYQVDGVPAAPVSPFTGWSPGVVVKLKRVTG